MANLKSLFHRPKWIVVIVGALVFWLSQTEWLTSVQLWQRAEGLLTDNRYLLRGPRPPDPHIKLIGLGSTSFKLDTLAPEEIAASSALQLMRHPWPWDRRIYAAILEKLMEAGAKVVVFDFVFPSETDGDDVFAQSLQKYRDRVVIGEIYANEEGADNQTKKLTTPNDRLLLPGTESISGLVNLWPDPDQVTRVIKYHTSIEREKLEDSDVDPRIANFLKQQIDTGKTPDSLTHITALAVNKFMGKAMAPPDSSFHLIDFQGGAGTYRPMPVENMFVKRLWQKPPFKSGAAFSNDIVVVGPIAEIFHDVHTTPFGDTPGPEIQCQIIAALLNSNALVELSPASSILLTLGAMALALIICLGIPHAMLKGILLVGTTMLFFAISQMAFTHNDMVIPMMPPLFCFIVTGSFGIIFDYSLEQLERRRYRNLFGRYVSKNVAKAILDDTRSLKESMLGQKKPVTILFCDIRAFTTMTELTDADKLVAQLNEYFAEMIDIIQEKNSGTLQKFIGDAIMAAWGDTHSDGIEVDARRAVTSALQMRPALAKLNSNWKNHPDRKTWSIGIGVNHGEVVYGNIGALERTELTVLGDAVNLAARLESATKQFHTDILIGEDTERLTREHFIYRSVGAIAFKGKTRPVETFLLLSDRSMPPPGWLATYQQAIQSYRGRKFVEAIGLFETVQQQIGHEDYLCDMYIAHCVTLKETSSADAWDGSFTLAEK